MKILPHLFFGNNNNTMDDPKRAAKTVECELCYETCMDKLIKIQVACISVPLGYNYICSSHDKLSDGFNRELIRCSCFGPRFPCYLSVYDPRSCKGLKHPGSTLPLGGPSRVEYLYPPAVAREESLEENEKTVGCDRGCGKKMKKHEIYASCIDCDDVYCSPRCTSQMASLSKSQINGVYESMCWVCEE